VKKLGAVVALIAVAAAFAFSLSMLRQVLAFWSPWFGLMIMLCLLGLIAFARPLFLLRMPGFLREVRAWETKGEIYNALRVPLYGVMLRRTPLRFLNPMVYLTRLHDPSEVMAQAESAEAAHLWAAAIFIPHMVYAAAQGWWIAFAWMMAGQIGFNLYPMMHLRLARARLDQLRTRMAKRAGR
jgi:hypothetical protein